MQAICNLEFEFFIFKFYKSILVYRALSAAIILNESLPYFFYYLLNNFGSFDLKLFYGPQCQGWEWGCIVCQGIKCFEFLSFHDIAMGHGLLWEKRYGKGSSDKAYHQPLQFKRKIDQPGTATPGVGMSSSCYYYFGVMMFWLSIASYCICWWQVWVCAGFAGGCCEWRSKSSRVSGLPICQNCYGKCGASGRDSKIDTGRRGRTGPPERDRTSGRCAGEHPPHHRPPKRRLPSQWHTVRGFPPYASH